MKTQTDSRKKPPQNPPRVFADVYGGGCACEWIYTGDGKLVCWRCGAESTLKQ